MLSSRKCKNVCTVAKSKKKEPAEPVPCLGALGAGIWFSFSRTAGALCQTLMPAWLNSDQVGKIMNGFLVSGRFIDDFLSINNPYLKHLLYTSQSLFYPDITGIYPDTLELALAHTGTSIPYTDINITSEPGGKRRITTQLYDKRKHPAPPPPLRGLHHQILSYVFKDFQHSQIWHFHRLRRIIIQRRNFVDNMANIPDTLTNKGYDTDRRLSVAQLVSHVSPF